MNVIEPDEFQQNIENLLDNNKGFVDPDLILSLGYNLLLCAKPEEIIFHINEKRLPEDVISIYTYFKSIESFRRLIFEEKVFSSDQYDFRLQTLIGLLESAAVIKKINKIPLSESEIENRFERLEILHNASTAMENEQFNIYLSGVIIKNPHLISLRTYFVISIMTYFSLSSMKREEYRLLQGIQQDILNWRKLFSDQTNLMEELP